MTAIFRGMVSKALETSVRLCLECLCCVGRREAKLQILGERAASYIERAVQLADRVSINLEAPTPDQLARIAPKKNYWRDLASGMEEVRRLQGRYPDKLRAGQITQMVVPQQLALSFDYDPLKGIAAVA